MQTMIPLFTYITITNSDNPYEKNNIYNKHLIFHHHYSEKL